LSTLTKVLIFLVSLFSFFLCGIVATYVVSADNYKKIADENNRKYQSARSNQESAVRDADKAKADVEAVKADLGTKLTDRDGQITKLTADLDIQKRLNSELQQRLVTADDRMSIANAATQQQATLHKAAQERVQALEADRMNREKELSETSQSLLEKVAIIAQFNDKVHQLEQEKQDLSTELNQYLVKYGKIAAQPPTTVLQGTQAARPIQPIAAVAPLTRNIALNGQITRVDLQNRLVEISIGTAAGVRQNMTFHVIRGDQFVADIQIMEVLPDQAVGVLTVVKQGMQPQPGDRAATNL
jgi:hypothetical protein